MRAGGVGGSRWARAFGAATLFGMCLLCAPAAQAEEAPALGSAIPTITADALGSALPTAGTVLSAIDDAEVSASGATITVAGGKTIKVDFSGKGGTYLKLGVLAFCASMLTRLLNTFSRIMRPFTRRGRRRRRRYDDEDV